MKAKFVNENSYYRMTSADYGFEAARKEGYDDQVYALLKIQDYSTGNKPKVSIEAMGSREDIVNFKKELENRNKRRNYSVQYYYSIQRVPKIL